MDLSKSQLSLDDSTDVIAINEICNRCGSKSCKCMHQCNEIPIVEYAFHLHEDDVETNEINEKLTAVLKQRKLEGKSL